MSNFSHEIPSTSQQGQSDGLNKAPETAQDSDPKATHLDANPQISESTVSKEDGSSSSDMQSLDSTELSTTAGSLIEQASPNYQDVTVQTVKAKPRSNAQYQVQISCSVLVGQAEQGTKDGYVLDVTAPAPQTACLRPTSISSNEELSNASVPSPNGFNQQPLTQCSSAPAVSHEASAQHFNQSSTDQGAYAPMIPDSNAPVNQGASAPVNQGFAATPANHPIAPTYQAPYSPQGTAAPQKNGALADFSNTVATITSNVGNQLKNFAMGAFSKFKGLFDKPQDRSNGNIQAQQGQLGMQQAPQTGQTQYAQSFGQPQQGQTQYGQPFGQPQQRQAQYAQPFGQSQQSQAQYGQPFGQPQQRQAQYAQPFGQSQQGQAQYGQPFGQPQQAQAQYAQSFGQPQQGQAQYGQSFGQPQQGQAQYGQPFGQPQQGQAQYGQPFGQPQQGQPQDQAVQELEAKSLDGSQTECEPEEANGYQPQFITGNEIFRTTTHGYLVFAVKSTDELMQTNEGKIALIFRLMDASDDDLRKFVSPLILGCAKVCMMLPASENHHDAFNGGLLAHNLNTALTALDWIPVFSTVYRNNFEQAFKKNNPANVAGERFLMLSGYNIVAEEQANTKLYDYSQLNLNSDAANSYFEHNFGALISFDNDNISKMPKMVQGLWKAFISSSDLKKLAKGKAADKSDKDDTLDSSETMKVSESCLAKHVLQYRYQRVKLLEALLPVPSFSVNDFTSLMDLSATDCKARLESFALQEQIMRNYFIEHQFEYLYDLGLVGAIDPEIEELAKICTTSFEAEKNPSIIKQRLNKNVTAPLKEAMSELQYAHPNLTLSQYTFYLKLACLFLSLIHDLCKVITDMQIFSKDGVKFDPNYENLDQFIKRTQSQYIYVRYIPAHRMLHDDHKYQACMLLARECPEVYNQLSYFFDFESIFQRSDSPLMTLIKTADRLAASFKYESLITSNTLSSLLVNMVVTAYQHTLKWQQDSLKQQLLQQEQAQRESLDNQLTPKQSNVIEVKVHTDVDNQSDDSLEELDSDLTGDFCLPTKNPALIQDGDEKDQEINAQKEAPLDDASQSNGEGNPDAVASSTNSNEDKLQPELIYGGLLPESGSCKMMIKDWLNLRLSLNTPYSDMFVCQKRVLIISESITEAKLSIQAQELEVGSLAGQSLIAKGNLLAKILSKGVRSPTVLTNITHRWFRIRLGKDLILGFGTDFILSSYEISDTLPNANFTGISRDDPLLQALAKGMIDACEEIVSSFDECKQQTIYGRTTGVGSKSARTTKDISNKADGNEDNLKAAGIGSISLKSLSNRYVPLPQKEQDNPKTSTADSSAADTSETESQSPKLKADTSTTEVALEGADTTTAESTQEGAKTSTTDTTPDNQNNSSQSERSTAEQDNAKQPRRKVRRPKSTAQAETAQTAASQPTESLSTEDKSSKESACPEKKSASPESALSASTDSTLETDRQDAELKADGAEPQANDSSDVAAQTDVVTADSLSSDTDGLSPEAKTDTDTSSPLSSEVKADIYADSAEKPADTTQPMASSTLASKSAQDGTKSSTSEAALEGAETSTAKTTRVGAKSSTAKTTATTSDTLDHANQSEVSHAEQVNAIQPRKRSRRPKQQATKSAQANESQSNLSQAELSKAEQVNAIQPRRRSRRPKQQATESAQANESQSNLSQAELSKAEQVNDIQPRRRGSRPKSLVGTEPLVAKSSQKESGITAGAKHPVTEKQLAGETTSLDAALDPDVQSSELKPVANAKAGGAESLVAESSQEEAETKPVANADTETQKEALDLSRAQTNIECSENTACEDTATVSPTKDATNQHSLGNKSQDLTSSSHDQSQSPTPQSEDKLSDNTPKADVDLASQQDASEHDSKKAPSYSSIAMPRPKKMVVVADSLTTRPTAKPKSPKTDLADDAWGDGDEDIPDITSLGSYLNLDKGKKSGSDDLKANSKASKRSAKTKESKSIDFAAALAEELEEDDDLSDDYLADLEQDLQLDSESKDIADDIEDSADELDSDLDADNDCNLTQNEAALKTTDKPKSKTVKSEKLKDQKSDTAKSVASKANATKAGTTKADRAKADRAKADTDKADDAKAETSKSHVKSDDEKAEAKDNNQAADELSLDQTAEPKSFDQEADSSTQNTLETSAQDSPETSKREAAPEDKLDGSAQTDTTATLSESPLESTTDAEAGIAQVTPAQEPNEPTASKSSLITLMDAMDGKTLELKDMPKDFFDLHKFRITGLTTGQIKELLKKAATSKDLVSLLPQRIIIRKGAFIDHYTDLTQFEVEFCFEQEGAYFRNELKNRNEKRLLLRAKETTKANTVNKSSANLEYGNEDSAAIDVDGGADGDDF